MLTVTFSVVSDSATPWTGACQAPLSVEFSRQEYWSGWPFPFPGYLPNPGIKPESSALWADSLPSKLSGSLYLFFILINNSKITAVGMQTSTVTMENSVEIP